MFKRKLFSNCPRCGLAFLSPKVVEAIASGTISADVTLTRLWSAQPLGWTQQEEQLLGFACV